MINGCRTSDDDSSQILVRMQHHDRPIRVLNTCASRVIGRAQLDHHCHSASSHQSQLSSQPTYLPRYDQEDRGTIHFQLSYLSKTGGRSSASWLFFGHLRGLPLDSAQEGRIVLDSIPISLIRLFGSYGSTPALKRAENSEAGPRAAESAIAFRPLSESPLEACTDHKNNHHTDHNQIAYLHTSTRTDSRPQQPGPHPRGAKASS